MLTHGDLAKKKVMYYILAWTFKVTWNEENQMAALPQARRL